MVEELRQKYNLSDKDFSKKEIETLTIGFVRKFTNKISIFEINPKDISFIIIKYFETSYDKYLRDGYIFYNSKNEHSICFKIISFLFCNCFNIAYDDLIVNTKYIQITRTQCCNKSMK